MMSEEIKEFYQVEYIGDKRIVKELSLPINLNLIVTKQCNANCIHCCASANEKEGAFFLGDIKKIVEIAKKNNIFYFVITGGEPFMYNQIWKLFEILNNKFGILLNTNGTLISSDIAKRLSSYNIANIHVSLDAPNQKIYHKQRGDTTKLKEVISGIKNLIDNNINITAKFVITNLNKDYMEDTIKLSISLEVKKMVFAWFKPSGRGGLNESELAINSKDVKKTVEDLYNLKKKYKNKIKLSFDNAQCFTFLIKDYKKLKYRKLCGDYFCRIDFNGDVFPCPFLEIKIGNLFKEDIKKIWKDSKLLSLRHFSWGKHLRGVCQKCNHNHICMGGCRARTFAIYGNLYSKDPLCWMKKK